MKKYIIPLIILVLASGLFIFKTYNSNKSSDVPENQQSGYEARINITLDFGNKETKTSELVADATDTAFSILKKFTDEESINLETKQYDFGIFIKKIGEFESTAKKSWIYYINGVSGQIAADQNKVKNGDKVEWKYETPK